MAHVTARVLAEIDGFGKIYAHLDEIAVHNGERPTEAGKIPGCDPDVLRALMLRQPTSEPLETIARLGVGGAAIIDDISKLRWIPDSDNGERIFSNFKKKCPQLFDEKTKEMIPREALVCLKRDGGAGGTFWCGDVFAGLAETKSLLMAAVREIVEGGFYCKFTDGGIKPAQVAFNDGSNVQAIFNAANEEEWRRRLGSTDDVPWYNGDPIVVTIGSLSCGDIVSIDGDDNPIMMSFLATEDKVGSCELICPAYYTLPEVPGGLCIHDTEHRPVKVVVEGEEKEIWVPLNRRPVIIIPLVDIGLPPLLIEMNPDGGVDPNGTIMFLERGLNWDRFMVVNSKVATVIERMGWLPAAA